MRRAWVSFCWIAGCAFESTGPAPSVDARLPADARPDTPTILPDASAPTCAGYLVLPEAQTTSRYRRVNAPTRWDDAKAGCEADGGHLVIPETQKEAVAVHAFVAPAAVSPYYWAGISDPERDGYWTTIKGEAFEDLDWGAGEPDRRTGEIYLLVFANGKLYDYFETGVEEYACECEP
jgi:hypothetical protein